jgi:hypothetical protein
MGGVKGWLGSAEMVSGSLKFSRKFSEISPETSPAISLLFQSLLMNGSGWMSPADLREITPTATNKYQH